MDWLLTIKSISGWIAGAVGSGLSIFFGRKKILLMKKWEIYFIFFSGILISHWVGGAIVEFYHIDAETLLSDSIKGTLGLIGFGCLARIHDTAPSIVDRWLNKWIDK
jgi:hypothetical protein